MDMVDLINRGAEAVASLNDASCLHKAAEQFLSAYAMFDGYGVVAASSAAERVLGAAMVLNPGLCVDGLGRTVIFDVNVASGTQLARVAKRLRDSGNSDELVGIALHSLLSRESDGPMGELAKLVVAHVPTADESSSRESSDRCCGSLMPAFG